MCRPINASKKKRNCQVKIMIVDEHVGIQGNRIVIRCVEFFLFCLNELHDVDAQSWFHSQKANILVDTPAVCNEWADGFECEELLVMLTLSNTSIEIGPFSQPEYPYIRSA